MDTNPKIALPALSSTAHGNDRTAFWRSRFMWSGLVAGEPLAKANNKSPSAECYRHIDLQNPGQSSYGETADDLEHLVNIGREQ